MTLLTITEESKINTLAVGCVYRENEVHQYQINIDNYNQIFSSLPQGDIPDDIAQYIGTKPENHTKLEDLPLDFSDEKIALISLYQYRVQIQILLRTEKAEQAKSKSILNAMKDQLPVDTRDQLILDAAATLAAQQPAQ